MQQLLQGHLHRVRAATVLQLLYPTKELSTRERHPFVPQRRSRAHPGNRQLPVRAAPTALGSGTGSRPVTVSTGLTGRRWSHRSQRRCTGLQANCYVHIKAAVFSAWFRRSRTTRTCFRRGRPPPAAINYTGVEPQHQALQLLTHQ